MEYSVRIHLGVWTLVFVDLLGIINLSIRGSLPLTSTAVETWAQVVTDRYYFLAQVLTIFAYIIPFLGFWEWRSGLAAHFLDDLDCSLICIACSWYLDLCCLWCLFKAGFFCYLEACGWSSN